MATENKQQHGTCPTCRTTVQKESLREIDMTIEPLDNRYDEIKAKYEQLRIDNEKMKCELDHVKFKVAHREVKKPQIRVHNRANIDGPEVYTKRTRRCVYEHNL